MAYSIGESVTGTVSGVTDYGAFVLLGDGSVGMVHISKLCTEYISDIRSFVKKGDRITATVISVENERIALSCVPDKPKRQRTPQKTDFESMLSSFKAESDERLSHLNKKRKR